MAFKTRLPTRRVPVGLIYDGDWNLTSWVIDVASVAISYNPQPHLALLLGFRPETTFLPRGYAYLL